MAGKTLADVYVDGQCIPAGSDASHELAAKVSNPAAWEDGLVPDLAEPATDVAPVPPKGGPGSAKDAWAAYAASKGVEVGADTTREDIIAALEAAGVPTEPAS